ncbi:MAG: beta-ketoacyl-ACP synthase II [Actinobacteria bacterium]|nr:beta-ketoacyl-ACP synthase II [Actinomycetota bacterium]
MGVISSIGYSNDAFFENLRKGVSGVRRISHFDPEGYATQIAAEVRDFDPVNYMELKQLKRMDRFSQLAVAAASIAIEDACLKIDGNADDTGVLVASGVGGLYTVEEQNKRLLELGPGRVSPLLIPMMIPNMAAAQVSIQFGARGPVNSVCTACAAGTQAIGDAFEVIRRGEATVMLCGGSEASITPLGISGFAAMKAMSTRNDEPQRASRPFDIERDGFVMGEGAGILVIEEIGYAISRGAKILAEVVGYGSTGDAYHLTALESSGVNAARAMQNAMIDAGVSSNEIGYINPHGTSTPLNDKVETKAIKIVLGEEAYDVPISSTKSMTGHCLGAAGAIEAAICVDVIRSGIIPPTINLDVPDPLCDLDYVPGVSRKKNVDVAMSNSMGFGGHNATIIFKRYAD